MATYLGVILVEAESNTNSTMEVKSVNIDIKENSILPNSLFNKHFLRLDSSQKINSADIDRIMSKSCSTFSQVDSKTLLSTISILEEFNIYEVSSCVDYKNYDAEVGRKNCLKKAKNRLWELLGFLLAWGRKGFISTEDFSYANNFSWAMQEISKGKTVCRKSWNNKQGLFMDCNKRLMCCYYDGHNKLYEFSNVDYKAEDWGYYFLNINSNEGCVDGEE